MLSNYVLAVVVAGMGTLLLFVALPGIAAWWLLAFLVYLVFATVDLAGQIQACKKRTSLDTLILNSEKREKEEGLMHAK